MDFYGIDIKGDVTTDDNSFDIGDLTHRFKEIHSVSFEGQSTSAEWADLAEKYICKGVCPTGTVMCGTKDEDADLEACKEDLSPSYVGVISEKPAFKMNKKLKNGKFVGLVGKLPVRIVGPVNKGDFIVPTVNGCARAGTKKTELVYKIGIAIKSDQSAEEKLVECIIK